MRNLVLTHVSAHTGRPWLGSSLHHRDRVCSGVFEQCRSSRESVVEFCDAIAYVRKRLERQVVIGGHTRQPPRSDNLDRRLQAVKGQLESDLVVTLTGTTVGDKVTGFSLSNFDHASSDNGSGERGTEKVDTFIDGVALHGSWRDYNAQSPSTMRE